MTGIKFYGSQVGSKIKLTHQTSNEPISLLYHDILTALKSAPEIIYIFWPIWPALSGDFCELAPTRANFWAIFLHVVLFVMQVPFVLSVPLWILLPGWTVIIGVAVFMVLNNLVAYLLNGPKKEFRSGEKFAKKRSEHEGEEWVFMNGVAAGEHWLQRNIDRIALTFGRPVTGLHNKTNGIVFDVLQVLWQRNFRYATTDVRKHFTILKALLFDPDTKKLVFMMHSQGAIEGGMIIDLLLQEIPQDLLAKLEVYTFGCAANHFNNPRRHVRGSEAEHSHSQKCLDKDRDPGKAIHHIEHYCHTKDFVARWGILHYINPGITEPDFPRFMGRVFQREGSGHMFGQHYFDNMFPLEPAPTKDGGIGQSGFLGADEKKNAFMNEDVEWVGKTRVGRQENLETSATTTDGTTPEFYDEESSDDEGKVGIFDESPINSRQSTFNSGFVNGEGRRAYKVRNLSRLWQYRNGKCPRVDRVDVKVQRMRTA